MSVTGNLQQRFADEMGALLGPKFPKDIGLAVSGGGDSMALLHLAAGWARHYGVTVWVATVDHGLRPESAAEARMVADECELLGLQHAVLTWSGWDCAGNLQDAARQARLDLLCDWSGHRRHILMGHTMNDQAETVLMRLMRGSGVDGLAGMSARRDLPPRPGQRQMTILRPLLGETRAALRHFCATLNIPFVDDPSNEDDRYDRVRVRKLIADGGYDVATLAATATQMQRARKALEQRTKDAMRRCLRPDGLPFGAIILDRDEVAHLDSETQLRLIAGALMQIGAQPYRPRLRALVDAVDRTLSGGTASLHGCLLLTQGADLVVCREPGAVAASAGPTDAIWDGRWQLLGPHDAALSLRALGESGILQVPDWREPGLPRPVQLAGPAIWAGETLVAAPLAGYSNGWQARIVADFHMTPVPH